MARVSMAAVAAAAAVPSSSSSSLAEERRGRSYYGYHEATASDRRLPDAAAQQPSQQLDAPGLLDFDLWESLPSNGWAVDDHGQPMAVMLSASDPRMLMTTNLPIQPASSPATTSFTSGWVVRTPSTSNISGFDDLRVPDRRSQSYGATDTRTLSTSDNISGTASDGSASLAGSPWASPQVPNQLYPDLMLPYAFYQSAEFNDQSYGTAPFPNTMPFDGYDPPLPCMASEPPPEYPLQPTHPVSYTVSRDRYSTENFHSPQEPWNPCGPISESLTEGAGVGAFGPDPGPPFIIHNNRQRLLQQGSVTDQPPSLLTNDAYGLSFTTGASSSTEDEASPEPFQSHSHVFSSVPGTGLPAGHRDRPKKLSPEKRKQTLAVRKHGACWACHLSKIRCSPCSSGSPCEQCTRLMGKRRSCHLSCFNDPVETLHPFLLPDYLVGRMTQANVESFISQYASSWGSYTISVRLDWGFKRLLPVDVVTLSVRGEPSEAGYHYQSVVKTGISALVRKKSPPLMIEFLLLQEMRKAFRTYVQGVVREDLAHYTETAYDGENMRLPQRVLSVVSQWHKMSIDDNDERSLLQEALEIHVISTILERSLILDPESLAKVEDHLRERYPPRTAARCAQRQIKLAFLMVQRQRTVRVLESWGKMMRKTSDSNTKWAPAFCVFIILILIMDKTIASAYLMCRNNIENRGHNQRTEMSMVQDLVRLMETQLFERCKEIFHSRYKTRKGANDRCNPFRDGVAAWRTQPVDTKTARLVDELQSLKRDFRDEIQPQPHRRHQTGEHAEANLGRLTAIFLGEFLDP